MCGLACVFEFGDRSPSPVALANLSERLFHRGPDDSGSFVHRNVGMVFRRLSIIDLSSHGHQPMLSESGRYAIVFNGEIFNYLELRATLEKLGHVFRSSSDTEVLLNAYIEWKEACLERLNGMWAFAILDTSTGECFFARDRFGVKPLYYYRTPERMVFASEVSPIVCSGLYRGGVNGAFVGRYLVSGQLDAGCDTLYDGISALAPGSWMVVANGGRVRSQAWWSMPAEADAEPDYDEVQTILNDAVRLRLRSDVPLGVFLSGGVDSTSILCSAARQRQGASPIKAYAYMPAEYGEEKYIRDTIDATGSTLCPLEVDADGLWNQLLRMAENADSPVHTPAALIGFCLYSMAARDGTKVILNGQGADETFAGYPNYFASYWQSLLRELKFATLVSQLRQYDARHRVGTLMLLRRTVLQFIKVQLNDIPVYRNAAARHHARGHRRSEFFSSQLLGHLPAILTYPGSHGLGEALRASVSTSPLPLYVRIEDRNSMAHSIEARLPFLDYRLVELAMRIASTRKLDGYWNKTILRQAVRGLIPESVRTRPDKMGFETPDAKWIRAWAPNIEAMFRSRSFAERGFFKVQGLLRALKDLVDGVRDTHEAVFRAVQVELCLEANERRAPAAL